jgi:hypothetical protein
VGAGLSRHQNGGGKTEKSRLEGQKETMQEVVGRKDCEVSDNGGTQQMGVEDRVAEFRLASSMVTLTCRSCACKLCLRTSVDADLEVYCPIQCDIQCNSRTCVLSESMECAITKIKQTGKRNNHLAVKGCIALSI